MAPRGAVAESCKTMGRSERGGLSIYYKQRRHMKITVEILDELLTKGKRYTSKHGTTMRA